MQTRSTKQTTHDPKETHLNARAHLSLIAASATLVLCAALSPLGALAATTYMGPAPTKEKPDTVLTISVHPLAPGVYAAKVRYGWVGWIEQGDGITLVDAAMDDQAAAALEDSIHARSGSKPIRYVVATHAHEDHVLGAKRFLDKGAILIAQANVASAIDSILGREHETKPGKKGAEPTTIEVKRSYTVGKGPRAAQVIYLGQPAHTWGDLVVYLPKQKVLFAGDIVSYRAVPWMLDPGMSRTGWEASVDTILGSRFDADSLVPGHGQIGPRVKAASWMKHYLVDAWEKAKGVAIEGGAEMAFRDWGYLGAYENIEFYQETHFMNMRRLYREARGINAPGRRRARALKY